MKMNNLLKTLSLGAIILVLSAGCSDKSEIDRKVDRLLAQMTLQEKIGQMNQLSGGANLAEAAAAGQVGSILNCVDPDEINIVQKAAVEQSRLGIPVLVSRDVIRVSCELRNSGDYEATEVVQLYVQDRVGSVVRPVRELKRFERVKLAPGEATTVTMELPVGELAFWNADMEYTVESGDFRLWVAGDSDSGEAVEFSVM